MLIVSHTKKICYNVFAVRLSAEGGDSMRSIHYLRDFLIAVLAGIVANFVFHFLMA